MSMGKKKYAYYGCESCGITAGLVLSFAGAGLQNRACTKDG